MTPKKYKLLRVPDHAPKSVKVGDFVYESLKHDYGLSSQDSRMSGEEHISVTLDPTGDYPFFTIPTSAIENENEDDPVPAMTAICGSKEEALKQLHLLEQAGWLVVRKPNKGRSVNVRFEKPNGSSN